LSRHFHPRVRHNNENAATEEPFQADHRKAFNGLALLIVRSKVGEAGEIQAAASSSGLANSRVEIATRSANRARQVSNAS
jgi:Glycoside hydrolase family 2 C-terminal domain 5